MCADRRSFDVRAERRDSSPASTAPATTRASCCACAPGAPPDREDPRSPMSSSAAACEGGGWAVSLLTPPSSHACAHTPAPGGLCRRQRCRPAGWVGGGGKQVYPREKGGVGVGCIHYLDGRHGHGHDDAGPALPRGVVQRVDDGAVLLYERQARRRRDVLRPILHRGRAGGRLRVWLAAPHCGRRPIPAAPAPSPGRAP